MERNRLYNRDHPHRESPESRKKSNRKYRISSYGLTQEQFDRLLDAQQHTCGMCHEPFEEGQLIGPDPALTDIHQRNELTAQRPPEPAGKLPLARVCRGLPVPSWQVTLRSRRWTSSGGGLGAMALTTCLGVVLSGSRRGRAPEVLVAAGLGLLGPVILTSREAV